MVCARTYDAAHQLETSVTAGGTTTYSYDAAGNLRAKAAPGGALTTYTWDAEKIKGTRVKSMDRLGGQ
jgi:YD repeat-containing protein